MTRTKKPYNRCLECQMLFDLCVCDDARSCRTLLEGKLRTRIVILMHHRERFLTTNTARLARLCLPDCEIHVRGFKDTPLDLERIVGDKRRALLLYPSENSQILSRDTAPASDAPLTLVVPDGSWRQASKVPKRESYLVDIPNVRLAPGKTSEYELRREPKAHGLATFEAIARALGILENPSVQENLEFVFAKMVRQTLQSRGIKRE